MIDTPTLFDGVTVPPIHALFGDDTPRVRRGDPLTSHAAADTSRSVTQSRALVLAVLTHRGPLADHELVDCLRHEYMTPQRVRTARHELVERGLVENTGATRKTATGRNAVVWAVVEGKAA
jgi:hypothetical protein